VTGWRVGWGSWAGFTDLERVGGGTAGDSERKTLKGKEALKGNRLKERAV